MAGWSRVLGPERAFAPSAVACLVLSTGACLGHGPYSQQPPDPAGSGGPSASAGAPGIIAIGSTGGSAPPPIGATGSAGPPIAIGSTGGFGPCQEPSAMGRAVFADQVLYRSKLPRRELFSWTTDEQAALLRRDRVLFNRTERPSMGPGYAFEVFQQIARDQALPERAALAELLGGELFAKARYAWSEPWAIRMGWPGEDYGRNLLRIVLRPEAWVAVVTGGDLAVFDLQNERVSLAQALANPTRLAAIFYQHDFGGSTCNGTFAGSGSGYREFIVGNLAMVEEWSLGTQQIRDRLSANITQLSSFLVHFRSCPFTGSAQNWNLGVVCLWAGGGGSAELTELSAYAQALAFLNDNYLAVPDRIAAMLEPLHGDLFQLDPLVVTPGSP